MPTLVRGHEFTEVQLGCVASTGAAVKAAALMETHRVLISQNVLPFVGLLVISANADRRQGQCPFVAGHCRVIPLRKASCLIYYNCGYYLGCRAAILCRSACHFGRRSMLFQLHRLDVERRHGRI